METHERFLDTDSVLCSDWQRVAFQQEWENEIYRIAVKKETEWKGDNQRDNQAEGNGMETRTRHWKGEKQLDKRDQFTAMFNYNKNIIDAKPTTKIQVAYA